jgi:hypothetical protein
MMDTKKITAIALLFFCLTGAHSQEIKKTETISGAFPLSQKVSWTGIELTSHFLAPETAPATSDPRTWKLIAETSVSQKLGGVAGTLSTGSFLASTGQIDCEAWVSDNKNLVAFRQTFTNKTKKIVKLNNMYPLSVDGSSVRFGNTGEWRIFEQFRHKNDLPKTEIPQAGSSISCDPFVMINNKKGMGKNLLIGFQTFSFHLADVQMTFGKDASLEKILARCEFEGVEVPPDGSRTSQWVIVSQGSDANMLIEDYTARIRAYYDMKKPEGNAPAVYCTWYYHADTYNEEIFEGDIAQFRKEHLPFDVFLIDECWDMNDWGDFESNAQTFPHGMKWVADEIKSAGYTAGIWTAPFLVDGESDLAKNHPLWLLKNSKGQLCTFNMNGRDHFIFDLTYPGVCEYLEDQFRKLAFDWGYRYFKFDFMRSVFIESDQQFFDKTATSLEAYRRGLEAIRRGVGNNAYISVCGGHYGASYGIANTQRSGSDVKSQWNEKELPKYRQNVLRTWMSGLWHVDPDAMMVRRQKDVLPTDNRSLTNGLFSDDEAFTNTLNQFIGGELVTFTEDFAKIDEDRKMLYRHVVPSVNSASRPVDMFDTNCPEIMITHIKPACKELDDWNMLSVVNWGNNMKDYEIFLDERITGDLIGNHFLVYDFRKGEILDFSSKGEKISINNVNGHESRLLKIVPWNGTSAMFAGTDLSFSCGGLEIAEITDSNGIISGTLETGWHVPVTLAFVIPSENGYVMKKVITSPGQKKFSLKY